MLPYIFTAKETSLPLTAWFLIQSSESWAIFQFDPESFDIQSQSGLNGSVEMQV